MAVMQERRRSKRILVIANETVAEPGLKAKILERTTGRAEVLVVCPALNSRLKHWFSDDDGARTRAADRLDASLLALWREGLAASGVVGDSDPIVALRDALAAYAPDEVIVSTHPPGRSNWLEKNVVERAQALCCPVPVFHIVAESASFELDAVASA